MFLNKSECDAHQAELNYVAGLTAKEKNEDCKTKLKAHEDLTKKQRKAFSVEPQAEAARVPKHSQPSRGVFSPNTRNRGSSSSTTSGGGFFQGKSKTPGDHFSVVVADDGGDTQLVEGR